MIHISDFETFSKTLKTYEKICVITDINCAKLLGCEQSSINALTHSINHFEPVFDEFSSACWAQLASELTKKPVFIYIAPASESAKSFKELERVCEFLCQANLSRHDLVLNIGGGVISDLGGFAAAIYKRGCDHINVPTTLLAAADASIGGKTGINNRFGKNLIGVFKEPNDVFIFPELFSTLDMAQLSCGWAEIIKMAACFNDELYAAICNKTIDLLGALKGAIEIKKGVVQRDLKESGERMLLNYGHTFAHAIEHEQKYKILHGHAVAIGMLMADELAKELNLLSESPVLMRACLQQYNLPTSYEIEDLEEFIDCMHKDKKNSSKAITFVLRTDAGAKIFKDIDINVVTKVLSNWQSK